MDWFPSASLATTVTSFIPSDNVTVVCQVTVLPGVTSAASPLTATASTSVSSVAVPVTVTVVRFVIAPSAGDAIVIVGGVVSAEDGRGVQAG